jgi:hypothetical protein
MLAMVVAAILYRAAPHETAAYRSVALTRTYWFIAEWRWYELFGLAAPIVILAVIGIKNSGTTSPVSRALARAGAVAGTVAVFTAAIFARTTSPTYLVARLQPLRIFQMVYILMILALGALLGQRLLPRRASRWGWAGFAILAAVMFQAQRSTYPHSSHFEWPGSEPRNGWEQAFEWIRSNTPQDALFALDADYITQPGEDTQTFRAIAERSALADYSKDGGEASITPELTAAWTTAQAAESGLATEPDAMRAAKLGPLGVTWVVLPGSSVTAFLCSYTNEAVKVCRLPARQAKSIDKF